MSTNAKGTKRRVYRWYATPWEILRQLPDVARHLRPEITTEELERKAKAASDTGPADAGSQANIVCGASAEKECVKWNGSN